MPFIVTVYGEAEPPAAWLNRPEFKFFFEREKEERPPLKATRKEKRAAVIDMLNSRTPVAQIAEALGVSSQMVYRVRRELEADR